MPRGRLTGLMTNPDLDFREHPKSQIKTKTGDAATNIIKTALVIKGAAYLPILSPRQW